MSNLKSLSALVDEYTYTRDARLARQKEVQELEAREKQLKSQLIAAMREGETHSVGSRFKRVTLQPKVKGNVTNWPHYYGYIKTHDAFDLLQRRVGEEALKSRWEEKIIVPGVEPFHYDDITISKV